MKTKNVLLEFYTDVLETLKVKVNEDGSLYIKMLGSKGKLPFTLNKIPMYLPTQDAIKTALEPDEDYKLQVVKELFNPLDESTNRGDNKSLLRLKLHIDKLLNHTFSVIGETLFTVLTDKSIEINDMYLLEIISALTDKKTNGRKTMVDDGTIKAFVDIYKHRISKVNKLFLHTFIKNGGKLNGESYNRMSVVSFPVLEEIMAMPKDGAIEGIKLRLKDKDAIEVLHTTIFSQSVDTLSKGLTYPSKDKLSPAFITLLEMYNAIATSLNNIIDGLISLNIDNDFLADTKLGMFPFKLEDLPAIIKNVQQELKAVPTNIAIQDTSKVYNSNVTNDNISNMMANNDNKLYTAKLYNNDTQSNATENNEPSAMDLLLGNNTQNNVFTQQSNQSNQNNLFGNQGNQNNLFGNQGNQNSAFGNQGGNSAFGNQSNQNSAFGNQGGNAFQPTVNRVW